MGLINYAKIKLTKKEINMKQKGLITGAIIVAAVLFFVSFFVGTYNNIITSEQNVEESLSNVKVQLQRRADLIQNLVNTVKGYSDHEEKVVQDIANARSGIKNADSVKELDSANSQVTSALKDFNVLVENYPDLKANQNYLSLQDELSNTENRVATARRDYNSVAKEYNTKIKTIPTSIIATIMGKTQKDYFNLTDQSKEEVPEVNFKSE